MSEEDGTLAQQFLNTWNQGQQILEQKLYEINRVKSLIENADAKTTFLETFTKNGGIFSANHTQPAPPSTLQPGSLDWIISKRRDLEQLAEELKDADEDQDPAYVLKSASLNDILIALETMEILTDEELANRMLIFLTNKILGSEDEEQVTLLRKVLKKYATSSLV